ncbi:uncharacterized protein BDR25DRAFT_47749 [Lindgomyces ingoldianus]|uniref:Uncharacterized protein n=1 Tax=Lindgomyces ingoldianus TaxID=673940 RepID=A0ACB6QQM5_9PLEO|nr:uncharacterized protein BDR25DRAFT_47749 [Lindgomyces ingoldianus]KAF2469288.1 hypothetical protein BDR25DRAFT_47749 [Lindgomyces ingoldianus]
MVKASDQRAADSRDGGGSQEVPRGTPSEELSGRDPRKGRVTSFEGGGLKDGFSSHERGAHASGIRKALYLPWTAVLLPSEKEFSRVKQDRDCESTAAYLPLSGGRFGTTSNLLVRACNCFAHPQPLCVLLHRSAWCIDDLIIIISSRSPPLFPELL